MSDDFDHYYKWFGIPPEDQPPNHYRLLGLTNFTEDDEVIANAADQRAAHLRTFQLGPRSALSQQVLNEVARARVCLLDLDKKVSYDAELRRHVAEQVGCLPMPTAILATPSPGVDAPKQPTPVAPTIAPVVANKSASAGNDGTRNRRHSSKSKNSYVEVAKIVAGGVAGLAIGYALICWLSPQNDFLGLLGSKQPKPVATNAELLSSPLSTDTPEETNEQAATTMPADADASVVVEDESTPAPPAEAVVESPAPAPVIAEPSPPIAPQESDEDRRRRLTAERDESLANGDIRSALIATESLSAIGDGETLDRRLAFVSTLRSETDTPGNLQLVTEYLLRLLEEAVNENRKDLAEPHTDHLIAGARQSGDQDLIRWATLCVLKIQQM